MKITFLGVGEACDPRHPNTSLLVDFDVPEPRRILLDCGFTTPHLYFAGCSDPDELDALWISHFHGDHFFGVPLLLLRFSEMGRQVPLFILGQHGIEDKIMQVLALAYPSVAGKLGFLVEFVEVEPGTAKNVAGLRWRTAENEHPQRCLSVRMDNEAPKSLFYSGDGRSTPASLALAAGCDLVVHEVFRVNGETIGHGSVNGALDFARNAGAAHLALLHLNRMDRLAFGREIRNMLKDRKDLHAFLPETGQIFVV